MILKMEKLFMMKMKILDKTKQLMNMMKVVYLSIIKTMRIIIQ